MILCLANGFNIVLQPPKQQHSFRPDAIEALLSQMEMTAADRATLINMRIDPLLLDVVVDFLYSPVHTTSVPPMIQLTSPLEVCGVTHPILACMHNCCTPLFRHML